MQTFTIFRKSLHLNRKIRKNFFLSAIKNSYLLNNKLKKKIKTSKFKISDLRESFREAGRMFENLGKFPDVEDFYQTENIVGPYDNIRRRLKRQKLAWEWNWNGEYKWNGG